MCELCGENCFISRYTQIYCMARIAIVPAVDGMGGMTSFRLKFEAGLKARGVDVTSQSPDEATEAVLVIAGTRNLIPLWRAKRRGVRVVQRLRRHQLGASEEEHRRQTFFARRIWYGNLILSFIRSKIRNAYFVIKANSRIVWWDDWYGKPKVPFSVVHNGIDLNVYNPNGENDCPKINFVS